MNEKILITEAEVQKIFGLNIRTLQGWRTTGEGPPFLKLGRSVRYRVLDINEWLNQQIKKSTSDK